MTVKARPISAAAARGIAQRLHKLEDADRIAPYEAGVEPKYGDGSDYCSLR